MRILLVDDSDTIRTILKGLLSELDIHDVVEAKDGEEALRLLGSEAYDMLLIDIHMPKMDGLAALEELRRRPHTQYMPVIFISSDTDPRRLERAKQLGAFGFIKKPFRVLGLRRAIEEATREMRKREQEEQRRTETTTAASSGPSGDGEGKKKGGIGGWLKRIFR